MDLVGAIKIKDGLFLGDEFAAQVCTIQDLEFVVANKVSHILNTSARQIPNHWEPIGVQYLGFYWLDHDTQQLFDQRDELVVGFCDFIDKAINTGESVLVHSVKGQSRSVVVILVYLMRTFAWTLGKSLDFVNSRRPSLNTRPSFLTQISVYETRLGKQKHLSSSWDVLPLDPEELILRNTFLNSRFGQLAEPVVIDSRDKVNCLRWADNGKGLGQGLTDVEGLNVKNRVEGGFAILRSSLKGGKTQPFERVPLAQTTLPRRVARVKGGVSRDQNRVERPPEPASGTENDPLRIRKARLDDKPTPESGKEPLRKPRALSAGAKDQNEKPVALRKMRFGALSKAANSVKTMSGAKTFAVYSDQRQGNGGLELQGKAAQKTRPTTVPNPTAGKAKGLSKTLATRGPV